MWERLQTGHRRGAGALELVDPGLSSGGKASPCEDGSPEHVTNEVPQPKNQARRITRVGSRRGARLR
jgi:hypothetical protein